MRRVGAIVAAAAMAACSTKPIYTALTKGPPRQVSVDKKATPPEPAFQAIADGGAIYVFALQQSNVLLTRKVTRSTYAIELRGNPALEFWETLVTPVMLVVLPVMYDLRFEVREGPESRRGYSAIVATIIDPRRTLLGVTYEGRVLDRDEFPDEPVRRRYDVTLPRPGAKIRYRVLSIEREVLAAGNATASELGEIEIADVDKLHLAVAVEIAHAGKTYLTLLERSEPAKATDAPEPSADDPEPSADDPEPSADDPEPSADDPEPSADDPEPSADDPEPSTDDRAPTTDGSESP